MHTCHRVCPAGDSIRSGGVFESESWFVAVTCIVAHKVCVAIVFNARSMELHDTMYPSVRIPYSRWCNLGGVILHHGVMAFDSWMTFVGLLIGFNLVSNWAL
jgi:hypothetical protein